MKETKGWVGVDHVMQHLVVRSFRVYPGYHELCSLVSDYMGAYRVADPDSVLIYVGGRDCSCFCLLPECHSSSSCAPAPLTEVHVTDGGNAIRGLVILPLHEAREDAV